MRQVSASCGADLPTPRPTPLHRYYHSPVGLPSCVTPSLAYYQSGSRAPPARPEGLAGFGRLASLGSAWALLRGYGNINPLSIDYACRPRLRSRLTLGGLAWPRNPWSFRRRSFSLLFRYSCLHSHSCGVHGWVTPPLHSPHDAPLPIHTPGRPPRGRRRATA